MVLFPFILVGGIFLAIALTFLLVMLSQGLGGFFDGVRRRRNHGRRSHPPPRHRDDVELEGADPASMPGVHLGRLLLFLLLPPYTVVVLLIAIVELFVGVFEALIASLRLLVQIAVLIASPLLALAAGRSPGPRIARASARIRAEARSVAGGLLRPLAALLGHAGFLRAAARMRSMREPLPHPPPVISDALPIDFPPHPPPELPLPFLERYEVLEQIPGGGSSAELFVVRRLEGGVAVGEKLLLKSFDLTRGAGLDSLVRESEGMRLAKRVGIVTDYMFGDDYFYYVMPFYEGETLTQAVGRQFRHVLGGSGLDTAALREALLWVRAVTAEVSGYHGAGLIHKDIKPENVILTSSGPRLVDVGLVTQLSSAMTLTTHGTEYFRDPELVRQAMAGTKVNEIAAERFDVYSLGALLYFAVQGTFPATGRFSRYERPVPYAVAAIANKAMSDFDKRHASAASLLEDLDALLAAGDLDEVQPARLPSFREPGVTREQAADPGPLQALPLAPASSDRRGGCVSCGAVLAALFLLFMLFGVWGRGNRIDRPRDGEVAHTGPAPEQLQQAVLSVRDRILVTARDHVDAGLTGWSPSDLEGLRNKPVLVVGSVLAEQANATPVLVTPDGLSTVHLLTASDLGPEGRAIVRAVNRAMRDGSWDALRLELDTDFPEGGPIIVVWAPLSQSWARVVGYHRGILLEHRIRVP